MTCHNRMLLTVMLVVSLGAKCALARLEFVGPPAPPPDKLPQNILPSLPKVENPPPPSLDPVAVESGPIEAVPVVVTESGWDDVFGRFLPRIGYSYDGLDTVGRKGGLSAFQAFLPVWQDRGSSRLLFSDSRLLLFDARGTIGANLGLGGRLFSETLGRTLGGYVYWDYSDTGRASFNQVSGGLETLGDCLDARANFYVPVGRDRKQVDNVFTPNSPEPYFQNNLLLVGGGQGVKFFEQALYGFDTEAGLKFLAVEGLELRAFAGTYHYQGEDGQQAWGPRGRLEARVKDSLAMGVSIQNDRLFGTTVNFNCLVSFGRMSGRSYSDGPSAPLSASDRLGDPVIRVQQVAVDRQREEYVVPGTPLVDPQTNQPYVFLHVAPGGNSDGSFENPYGTLAQAFADPRFAKGNLIVYDRTSGSYQGNVALAPGTRLLSSGPLQTLNTTSGQVILPYSGAGNPLPRIEGTITLANQTTISGFELVGVGPGAVVGVDGNVLRDVTLSNNVFSGQGHGIWLPNVAGTVLVQNNQFYTPSGSGFVATARGANTAKVTVRDSQFHQPQGDAVAITAEETSKVEATIERNQVRGAGGSGVLLQTGTTAKASIDATVQQNTIEDSGANGNAGIALLSTGAKGGSRIRATVRDNEMTNNHSPGFFARAFGPNTMLLDVFRNKSISPRSMFGFLFSQQKNSTFGVVDPATVGSRNNGSVITAGTIDELPTLPDR